MQRGVLAFSSSSSLLPCASPSNWSDSSRAIASARLHVLRVDLQRFAEQLRGVGVLMRSRNSRPQRTRGRTRTLVRGRADVAEEFVRRAGRRRAPTAASARTSLLAVAQQPRVAAARCSDAAMMRGSSQRRSSAGAARVVVDVGRGGLHEPVPAAPAAAAQAPPERPQRLVRCELDASAPPVFTPSCGLARVDLRSPSCARSSSTGSSCV